MRENNTPTTVLYNKNFYFLLYLTLYRVTNRTFVYYLN